VRHSASSSFWAAYRALPENVQVLADKSYQLLKHNPAHPSLHFKPVGRFWSVRVGLHYRALGVLRPTASFGSGFVPTLSTSASFAPNYSFKRNAATGCGTIMRCAAAAA